MKYQVEENCLTIFLPSEVDHHNAEKIRRKSDRLIEKHHIKCVIFDFGETNFMDSSGIGVIMGRYRMVSEHKCARGPSRPRDHTCVSRTAGRFFTI